MASPVQQAAAALAAGGLVVYPTETVYGLGADATSGRALDRLLAAKGRAAEKGISVLVADLAQARSLVSGAIPTAASRLAAKFWPGPLTLVLEADAALPRQLVGGSGGVGLRCSSDATCAALLSAFGRPLTSTSANRAGGAPATTVVEARAQLGAGVDCYLDGGPRAGRLVSTVVEFVDGGAYLRRVGAIGADALAAIVSLED